MTPMLLSSQQFARLLDKPRSKLRSINWPWQYSIASPQFCPISDPLPQQCNNPLVYDSRRSSGPKFPEPVCSRPLARRPVRCFHGVQSRFRISHFNFIAVVAIVKGTVAQD